ncbi:hypothetical protein ACFY04_30445 [Streptomyces sp. NPDC001549]|uniref:hypothetical protein n=1 Tax=Streptomyces sp. NPDC001549 TaxID=3364586 RepID=UPI003695621F
MTDVNDLVEQQIDAAKRRRQAQQQRRAALDTARQHGLTARHRAKLARINTVEQHGARLALAALRRDSMGVAVLLEALDPATSRQAAAIALGALAELGLSGRPGNVVKARDALARMEASGPDPAA